MPLRRELYPPNWAAISKSIREREGQKCKWCGVPNHERGARDRYGVWHNVSDIDSMKSDTGFALFGDYPKIIKIILTVAHIDHDPSNNADENLAALCQRCHLNHDREHHMENARETWAKKREQRIAATGQSKLDL